MGVFRREKQHVFGDGTTTAGFDDLPEWDRSKNRMTRAQADSSQPKAAKTNVKNADIQPPFLIRTAARKTNPSAQTSQLRDGIGPKTPNEKVRKFDTKSNEFYSEKDRNRFGTIDHRDGVTNTSQLRALFVGDNVSSIPQLRRTKSISMVDEAEIEKLRSTISFTPIKKRRRWPWVLFFTVVIVGDLIAAFIMFAPPHLKDPAMAFLSEWVLKLWSVIPDEVKNKLPKKWIEFLTT